MLVFLVSCLVNYTLPICWKDFTLLAFICISAVYPKCLCILQGRNTWSKIHRWPSKKGGDSLVYKPPRRISFAANLFLILGWFLKKCQCWNLSYIVNYICICVHILFSIVNLKNRIDMSILKLSSNFICVNGYRNINS